MKIVFMGTPDFALPSLEKLFNSRHEIAAVVTAPDKERGRGQKITFTPVKEFALKNGLPLLQPDKLKDKAFTDELKQFNVDLFVIVAFRILPVEVFTIPPKGSFNLHASLLPRYRGAAPIQWSIINGDKETGVTTFALEEKVDTGNIYLQEKITIEESDDFGSLHDKLSILGAGVVLDTVNLIESENFILKPQDSALSSPAPKITKETGAINWNSSAESVHNLVRGLSPYPGAYFYHKGIQIKIYKTEVTDKQLTPGQVQHDKKNLYIGCSDKSLKILEIQKEGKKRLTAEEFLRGFNFN
jgi:methionyl-tRNA formyltransferase